MARRQLIASMQSNVLVSSRSPNGWFMGLRLSVRSRGRSQRIKILQKVLRIVRWTFRRVPQAKVSSLFSQVFTQNPCRDKALQRKIGSLNAPMAAGSPRNPRNGWKYKTAAAGGKVPDSAGASPPHGGLHDHGFFSLSAIQGPLRRHAQGWSSTRLDVR